MKRYYSFLSVLMVVGLVIAALFHASSMAKAQESQSHAPRDPQGSIDTSTSTTDLRSSLSTDPSIGLSTGTSTTLSTSFTYQGKLSDIGSPANGVYDFEFSLYDSASGGAQVGGTVTLEDVTVSDGLFTVELDFGDVFDGTALWLEIGMRKGSSTGTYTTLSPRQFLTAAPYALYALDAGPHDHWGQAWSGNGTGLTLSGGDAGLSANGDLIGVYGESTSTLGRGVFGWATATSGQTIGVHGRTDSTLGQGVIGYASATSGTNYGVGGVSSSTDGRGVNGYASATSGLTYGVSGRSDSTNGRGVYGYAIETSGVTYGVYGQSDSTEGRGVYGLASATNGTTYGMWGESASPVGRGVFGLGRATSGTNIGVHGRTDSTSGRGVLGTATATSGSNYGVRGGSNSTNGTGVYGEATATSGVTYGVYGESASSSGRGVYGLATATTGRGVFGHANTTTGLNYGVYGSTNSPAGYAGYFSGDVEIIGDFTASGTKSFKIDNPLDPANQYLYHYSVESSEVVNQYTGNVTLDENGTAWVQMPEWFEAINTDFRYQLTPIGGWAPLYVAQEIKDNVFQIAGGEPGMKVSWEVTALRNDPYLQQYPHPAEVEKPESERGTYLQPELYGQPEELGLDYQNDQDLLAP